MQRLGLAQILHIMIVQALLEIVLSKISCQVDVILKMNVLPNDFKRITQYRPKIIAFALIFSFFLLVISSYKIKFFKLNITW